MADACPTCAAHQAAIPTEVQLRQLISEDEGLEMDAFVPLAGTGQQAAALAAYAHAVHLMVGAFGIEIAGARVRRTLAVVRSFAKLSRVFRRADAARAPLLDEIRARHQRGEIGAAEANALAAEAPTPDYEGKARDEAWLREATGGGIHAL